MTGFVWDWHYAWSAVPSLLDGLKLTVEATVLGAILAIALGPCWTLLRMMGIPVLSPAIALLLELLRGTPFLVQIFFLFYVLPNYGVSFSAIVTGILGLGLYYSSYAAEIYRAGTESVAAGQWEACLTLGLPVRRVWIGIVLPQIAPTIAPMLGSLVIVMFKETALLSTITVTELLARGMEVGFLEYRFIEPLTLVGALYFAVSYVAAYGVRILERHNALQR